MTEEQKQPAADQQEADAQNQAPPAADNGADAEVEPKTGEKISDPVAFLKSQAEKYERLFTKAQERATSLEEKIKGLEEANRTEVEQRIAELRQEWEAEKAESKKQYLDAVRTAAVAKFNLHESFKERLKGESEDEIMADAQALADVLPQGSKTEAKRGNPGGGSKLTVDDLKDKSAKWISENWDQVEGILGDQQKK